MDEISIDLTDSARVELRAVDIGVEDKFLAFSVEGVINGVGSDALEELAEKSLKPTEIHFDITDN